MPLLSKGVNRMKWSANWNWKKLFFLLLSINFIILFVIVFLIFWPMEEPTYPQKEFIEEDAGAEFTIRSGKENLTELANAFLKKLPKEDNFTYMISLDDEVKLLGTIIAFGAEVPIQISFDPVVQENGDIILQSTNMSLGLLRLPQDRILKYVNDRIDTPEWITINPKEEHIYIAVTQMELKSNFKVKVQQFDLENDNITFRIKVPNKTLGL